MTELLAPGGSQEKIQTAFRFGADAVYCGGPAMHLRASDTSLSMDELAASIGHAHTLHKKLYVTVNAFTRNRDFEALPDYLKQLHSMQADGIIVSDLGVLSVAAKTVPDLPVHISTQASCLNYEAAMLYYQLGAKRIVLGRELSLDEIKEIRDKTPPELELEAFIHGAMCMAYSGRCLISAFLTGRNPNNGGCAHPCRWNYHLVEEKRPNEYFPVIENDQGMTILSAKDLKTIAFIDQIQKAGINSFKIEGRMKSPYYVAVVTNAYRHALDADTDIALLEEELLSVSHREYSPGFYLGSMQNAPSAEGGYQQDSVFIAVVKDVIDGRIEIEQRNKFSVGDVLEVVSPKALGQRFPVTAMWDMDGNEVQSAPHPQQTLFLKCPLCLHQGDILRRRLL